MEGSARGGATIQDLLARPEDERLELYRGTLVQKAPPSAEHGTVQAALGSVLWSSFRRGPGIGPPWRWWLMIEVDIELGRNVFRPDIIGFRRDRVPERPTGRPVSVRPDWICEILSPSNRDYDRLDKMRAYFAGGVPHYWLVDPEYGTLEVFRIGKDGYEQILGARRGERVRAGPFDAVELSVSELLGGDPEDDAP